MYHTFFLSSSRDMSLFFRNYKLWNGSSQFSIITLKAYNNIFESKNNKTEIEWGTWNSQKGLKSVKCMSDVIYTDNKNEKTNKKKTKNRRSWEWSKATKIGGVHLLSLFFSTSDRQRCPSFNMEDKDTLPAFLFERNQHFFLLTATNGMKPACLHLSKRKVDILYFYHSFLLTKKLYRPAQSSRLVRLSKIRKTTTKGIKDQSFLSHY